MFSAKIMFSTCGKPWCDEDDDLCIGGEVVDLVGVTIVRAVEVVDMDMGAEATSIVEGVEGTTGGIIEYYSPWRLYLITLLADVELI